MYLEIKRELINKGFFDANGSLSKFVGSRIYEVWEEGGLFWIETTFDGKDEAKNQLLDHIQSLAPRYALTQAKVRSGKLRVDLTRPDEDPQLEATRIDFLTQSLEAGIVRLEPAGASLIQPVSGKALKGKGNSQLTDESAELIVDPDEDSYYDVQNEDEEPVLVRSAKPTKHGKRSTGSYIRPEENPHHRSPTDIVVTGLVDRSFSILGFLAAGIGAVLGALLMSGVHVMGVPAQPVAFLIPFLVIGIYRVMASHQMSIILGVILVLGSLLLGSVLISAIEVLQQTDAGLVSALKQGILAHYNNEKYFVQDVWTRYGISVIAASIPTILLLSGGKKQIQYSK